MRQKFDESHWDTLLPERLESYRTRASSKRQLEAREGPCSSAAGHMGLIQAEAGQEILAPENAKEREF